MFAPRQTMLYTKSVQPHEKSRLVYTYDVDGDTTLYHYTNGYGVMSHVYELPGDMGHWGP